MVSPGPSKPERDLPPEAIRNIRRRYGRIRWLAYGLLGLITVELLLGRADIGLAAVVVALALLICAATWFYSRRAIRLARYGHVVEGTIVNVRTYPVVRWLVGLHGLVDVVIEYEFDDKVFRLKKSISKALNPRVGAAIKVVVDPGAPRRAMLLFDLRSRLAKS